MSSLMTSKPGVLIDVWLVLFPGVEGLDAGGGGNSPAYLPGHVGDSMCLNGRGERGGFRFLGWSVLVPGMGITARLTCWVAWMTVSNLVQP